MPISLELNILNRIAYLKSNDEDEELSSLHVPKHLHSEEEALLRRARLADLDFQKALLRWNPDIELEPQLELNSQVRIVPFNDEGQVLLTRNQPRIICLDDKNGEILKIRVNSKYSLWKADITTDDFTDIYNLVCVNAVARILKIERIKKEILSQLILLPSCSEKTLGPVFAIRMNHLKIEEKDLEWVSLKAVFSNKDLLDEKTIKTLILFASPKKHA